MPRKYCHASVDKSWNDSGPWLGYCHRATVESTIFRSSLTCLNWIKEASVIALCDVDHRKFWVHAKLLGILFLEFFLSSLRASSQAWVTWWISKHDHTLLAPNNTSRQKRMHLGTREATSSFKLLPSFLFVPNDDSFLDHSPQIWNVLETNFSQ